MASDEVRCDVKQRSWQVPARPAGCTGSWATGVVTVGTGKGELSCVQDTLDDPSLAVLAYGEAVRLAGLVCVSRETGVRCENSATLHGFSLSRTSCDLF